MTTTAIPAAGEGLPGEHRISNIDDAVAEFGTLASVIAAAYDILHEMDYGLPGGGRNVDLDKVAAVVLTARRLAADLVNELDRLPRRFKDVAAAREGAVA